MACCLLDRCLNQFSGVSQHRIINTAAILTEEFRPTGGFEVADAADHDVIEIEVEVCNFDDGTGLV
jgi:hypothetical protein